MQQRGVVSDKRQLISILEKTYTKASSEKDFYKRLKAERLELYSRNSKTVGVKLNRKFRFKTLGYDKSVLQELDKNLSKNKRLNTLKRIREHQKQQSKGLERTRKRGR